MKRKVFMVLVAVAVAIISVACAGSKKSPCPAYGKVSTSVPHAA